MPKPISMTDLLNKIGDDNLKFQILNRCLDGQQKATKHGTRFSFCADEDLGAVAMAGTRTAFIIWMDQEKVDAAYAALKEERS
ncbi:hypothetical protein CPT_Sonora_076 [Stenotrophomonas phage Sonora]|nr:hypothetical protein CPT_Sonora_076 [Stenotrophomonas phage Sonora]